MDHFDLRGQPNGNKGSSVGKQFGTGRNRFAAMGDTSALMRTRATAGVPRTLRPPTKLLSESTLSLSFFRDVRQQDIDRVVECVAATGSPRSIEETMPAVEIGAEPIVYRIVTAMLNCSQNSVARRIGLARLANG